MRGRGGERRVCVFWALLLQALWRTVTVGGQGVACPRCTEQGCDPDLLSDCVCVPNLYIATRYADRGAEGARHVAIQMLAVMHVNQRNGTVVGALAELPENFRLKATVAERYTNGIEAAQGFHRACVEPEVHANLPSASPTAMAAPLVQSMQSGSSSVGQGVRCAGVVGPSFSSDTAVLGSYVNVYDTPVVSHSATSPQLKGLNYPMFGRTVLSDTILTEAVISLFDRFGWTNVGVLHDDADKWSHDFAQAIVNTASIFGVRVASLQRFSLPVTVKDMSEYKKTKAEDEELNAALGNIKASGAHIILAVVLPNILPWVVEAAARNHSLMEPQFTWVVPELYNSIDTRPAQLPNGFNTSWVDGFLTPLVDGFDNNQAVQGLTTAYREQMAQGTSSELYQQLPSEVSRNFNLTVEGSMTVLPDSRVGNGYDVVVAYALALNATYPQGRMCAAEGSATFASHTPMSAGSRLWQALTKTQFAGVSGQVTFDEVGERQSRSMLFVLGRINAMGQHSNVSMVAKFGIVKQSNGTQFELRRLDDIRWRNGQSTGSNCSKGVGEGETDEGCGAIYNLEDGSTPRDGLSCERAEWFDGSKNECVKCPPGTSENRGNMSCTRNGTCGMSEQDRCATCLPGTYSNILGSLDCEVCLYNKETATDSYSIPNRTACASCPANSFIKNRNTSSSINACLCLPGYYTKRLNIAESYLECAACPKGAFCEGDQWNETLNRRHTKPPSNLPGYWNGDDAAFDQFIECSRSSTACVFQEERTVLVFEHELRDEIISQCASKYEGRQCNRCKKGSHDTGRACIPCLRSGIPHLVALAYIVLPLIVFLGFFHALVYLQKMFPSLSYSYMTCQVIALLGDHIDFGPGGDEYWVPTFLRGLNMVNFNSDLAYLDCSLSLDYVARWWLVMALPFIQVCSVYAINLVWQVVQNPTQTVDGIKDILHMSHHPREGGTQQCDPGLGRACDLRKELEMEDIHTVVKSLGIADPEMEPTTPRTSLDQETWSPTHSSTLVRRLTNSFRKKARRLSQMVIKTTTKSALEATTAILILFRATYLPVLKNCLEALVCDSYGGKQYLRFAPEVECYSGRHNGMMAFASIMLVCFTLGFPAFIAGILWYGKHTLKLGQEEFSRHFGCLYMAYESEFYLFGLMSFFHMALLTTITLTIRNVWTSIVLCMAVLFVRISAQVFARPYLTDWRDMHSAACLLCTIAVVLLKTLSMGNTCASSEGGQALHVRSHEINDHETYERHGVCWDTLTAFWALMCWTALVIAFGLICDIWAFRNSSQISRRVELAQDVFFLNCKGNGHIHQWLESDPRACRAVSSLAGKLREWLADRGVNTPLNHFKKKNSNHYEVKFLQMLTDRHPYMIPFLAQLDEPTRLGLINFIECYDQFRLDELHRPNSFAHGGRWIGVVAEPFLAEFLLRADEAVQDTFEVIIKSYEQYIEDRMARTSGLGRLGITLQMFFSMYLLNDNVTSLKTYEDDGLMHSFSIGSRYTRRIEAGKAGKRLRRSMLWLSEFILPNFRREQDPPTPTMTESPGHSSRHSAEFDHFAE